ncbi:hypothetical protein B0H63DRAFT_400568 [Podospora didyma]|uniref:Nucleoporin n=1 Tax=Podospora didyma TaxID=330526 RepID=A0AAE0KEP3_9PEZI|nr:hypothetical protein B0H63DRAFT_400568 [Podospora didyma]
MASKLNIHKPYVLKALSHPLDRPDGPGRHAVGEVFGQKQDSKRRKRSELAVAIDGDAVHLYDILSAQAITAYLVSPQSFFTCTPYSLRWRPFSSTDTSRYTYVSTEDSRSSKKEIKLFKDVLTESGNTTATTASHAHCSEGPIVYLSATSAKNSGSYLSLPSDEFPHHDIIAVAADGTLLGLNGETLEQRWQSSPSVLAQELPTGATTKLQVDFVQSALAADVIDGVFGGKNDLFGVFQEKIHRDGFNPDILVVITSLQGAKGPRQRHLHILALAAERQAQQDNKQNVIPVFAAPLPTKKEAAKYQLDVRSGTLQELSGEVLSTYTLSGGIPRLETRLEVSDMTSFLRLSKTSVLTATTKSLSVYNPIYRSLQSTTPVDSLDTLDTALVASQTEFACELVTYFASRELAVGLRGASLVAVQIEAPKSRSSKRRAEGLLTDAIRCGIAREQVCEKRNRVEPIPSAIIEDTLPGSLSDTYWAEWQSASTKADEFLRANNLRGFEELLAGIFKVQIKGKEPKLNGVDASSDGSEANGAATASNLCEWIWPSSRTDYPHVDRRWIFYAISRVFSWNNPSSEGGEAPRLACRLPESSVLNYLVDAGHLSISNLKSAFQDEIRDVDDVDSIIGAELPPLLVQIDATMELLLVYLSGTQLGPMELVSAIKLLLRSLAVIEDPSKTKQFLIKDAAEEQEADGDNDAINMELDRAEEELQITEYYLDSDVSRRARGLSLAFSKLGVCPALNTVQSLRRLLKPEEILSLIQVLRMELHKDGWITRYADTHPADEDDIEAPPDGSIQLIADLMCRCIDSVGLGGWMAFDKILPNWGNQQDSADFFGEFLSDISLALEGAHEVVMLQAIIAETVGYVKKARKALAESAKSKVTSVQLTEELPFGLKTDSKASKERVRSGAEVVQRSRREIGHFVSKKRLSYSVQRISEESLRGLSGPTVVHGGV